MSLVLRVIFLIINCRITFTSFCNSFTLSAHSVFPYDLKFVFHLLLYSVIPNSTSSGWIIHSSPSTFWYGGMGTSTFTDNPWGQTHTSNKFQIAQSLTKKLAEVSPFPVLLQKQANGILGPAQYFTFSPCFLKTKRWTSSFTCSTL